MGRGPCWELSVPAEGEEQGGVASSGQQDQGKLLPHPAHLSSLSSTFFLTTLLFPLLKHWNKYLAYLFR